MRDCRGSPLSCGEKLDDVFDGFVGAVIGGFANHDGRVVTIGQLTRFSSETGDAWIIDRDDHLALRLAHDGDPEPFHIDETETSFAIHWTHHYRIEGAAFVFTDRDTRRTTTVIGYTTDKLAPGE